MKTLLFLALCLPAYAAPLPPMPTVTRPAPLLSPRHASQPKSAPMFVTASENPPIPMVVYFQEVNDDFGRYKIRATLTQPRGYACLFEYSPTVGSWRPLAWFGPDPNYTQEIEAYIHSNGGSMFIRASLSELSVAPSVLTEVRSMVVMSEAGNAIMARRTTPKPKVFVLPMSGAGALVRVK